MQHASIGIGRRTRTIGAGVVAALLLAIWPAAAATAGPAEGWVRVAHLSPDTKQVDVTLSSLSGGQVLYKLSSVGFGNVSPYMRLPQGTYSIAMVPAGAKAGTTPVVTASVQVTATKAETVAALGLNKDLSTKVFSDDLAAPAAGDARLRVVQASTKHASVDVTAGSTSIATDTAFGDASSYSSVDAGSTTVTAKAASVEDSKAVALRAGSVHTLFVLDTASGGLAVSPVLDSFGSSATPVGAIDTGAGGLDAGTAPAGVIATAGAVAAAAATGGVLVIMRRRPVAARV